MLVRRRPSPVRAAAVLALIGLLAGACSDANSGAEATAPPSPAAATTEEPTEAEASPSPSPTETETEVALAEAPDIVRGVYSTVYSFWGERWAHLIELVETTELNAIVVDVKDEAGTLLWHIDHPLAEAGGGAAWKPESDPEERLQMLLDAGGYAIARVACFKDTLVAQARPDLAVQDQGGNAWKARKDFSWLNPYQDEAG
ncbi:MAG: putative glycoside hydrolase, partial [Actinobacteria bacterium]|nr:putative glycoside hydrolase [Actinomycetota bacterium]